MLEPIRMTCAHTPCQIGRLRRAGVEPNMDAHSTMRDKLANGERVDAHVGMLRRRCKVGWRQTLAKSMGRCGK